MDEIVRVLVITEKNNTANRIAYILSDGAMKRRSVNRVSCYDFQKGKEDWTVVGLRGHIMELDYPEQYNSWESTDVAQLIWVKPQKNPMAPHYVDTLRAESESADRIILATDYDREGELIGVEALEILGEHAKSVEIRRARFSALTRSEIEGAFSTLVDVDYRLADAAASRGEIDLAWGAVLTRFISLASNRRGREFLSVGRVQSPTLALIVDKEREVEEFVPKPFWTLYATFEKERTFLGTHLHGRFWGLEEAEAIYQKIQGSTEGEVQNYRAEDKEERPPVPFNTTQFLAEATRLGFSAAVVMKIAEDLYSRGYISYPRTDNTTYPPSLGLKPILKKLLSSEFKKEAQEVLDQPTIKPTRGRSSTTDHPPIHPVEGATKKELRAEAFKIYELVVRRFLATLAPACLAHDSLAEIAIRGETFESRGHKILDLGWRKYYPYWRVDEMDLPILTIGEKVPVLAIEKREDRTRPPPRYSQGSLIQEMERLGLGTKSTRHEILQKLFERHFVQSRDLRPTISGKALIEALEQHAPQLTDAQMTATLEADMERIVTGETTKTFVVEESQKLLKDVLEVLQEHREAIGKEIGGALRQQEYIGKCKRCGGELLIRRSREGSRFVGCAKYPECRNTHSLPQSGFVAPAEGACPDCGSSLIKHISGGHADIFCIDTGCPSIKAKNRLGKCGKCGGDLEIRHSRRDKRFVGCTGYPQCDNSGPLPQLGLIQPTESHCETCGSPIIRVIMRGRPPWVLCINQECPTKRKKEKKKTKEAPAVAEGAKPAKKRRKTALKSTIDSPRRPARRSKAKAISPPEGP